MYERFIHCFLQCLTQLFNTVLCKNKTSHTHFRAVIKVRKYNHIPKREGLVNDLANQKPVNIHIRAFEATDRPERLPHSHMNPQQPLSHDI